MKNNSGFTLTELLIVIVIVSILLSIAVLSGRTWIGKARVEQQIRQLYADLLSARMGAMNRNRTHFLVVNAASRQYEIWEDTDPEPFGNEDRTAADTRHVQTTLKDVITVVTGTSASYAFNTRGLTSDNATFRIGDGEFSPRFDCLVISATRIRLGRYEGADCVP